MRLVPVLWVLIWSILALGYIFRRGQVFRWGMGGKGPLAPIWLGRSLFVLAAAYGLFWVIVTGGEDLGYVKPTSKFSTALEFINSHLGLFFVDGFLAAVFLTVAVLSVRNLKQAPSELGGRATSVTIALAAGIIGVFSLVRFVLKVIRL
jgi:hypothetical protein